jgi:hypothetical protein
MCFCVRTEADTEAAAFIRHGIEIPLEGIQIDHEGRRIDFGEGGPDTGRGRKRHAKRS